MIPIFIDTTQLSEEFTLTKKEVEDMIDFTVKSITKKVYKNWEREASDDLKSTRRQYIRNLIVKDTGRGKGQIMLIGQLQNMIESGVGAFDMKEGFSKSSKKKTVKRKDGSVGWYLTIPFRWATPSAVGDSDVFSAQMPDQVYAIVKNRPTDIPIARGTRSEGIKVSDLPTGFQEPKTRPAVSNLATRDVFAEYKNKSSIYEGITKVQDKDTGQHRYMSFRRVSDLSDPMAFVHSGIMAKNFADKALGNTDIPTIVDKSIDNYLSSIGF